MTNTLQKLFLLIALIPLALFAEDTKKKDALTPEKYYECISALQSQFSNYTQVAQALSIYRINQSQWVPIANAFRRNVTNLNARIQKKASTMHPSPLDPFDPKRARQILRTELAGIVIESLKASSYPNETGALGILNYLISKQEPDFESCFKEVITDESH